MARYYAETQGNRGKASRMGSKDSGIWSHTRGWNVGARVECRPGPDEDRDIVTVAATGGSADGGVTARTVAVFREHDDRRVEVELRHPRTGKVVARHILD